jgi:mono/diheme cytochrome c family protein
MMRSGFALAGLALSGLVLGLSFAAGGPALGQEGKIAEGRAVALRACGACHVVADDQAVAPTLNPPAPPFAEIAARPKVTEAFLRDFLTRPHGDARTSSAMPGFLMPSSQAEAAIAYLISLKPAK